jgi:carbamoyltransferase
MDTRKYLKSISLLYSLTDQEGFMQQAGYILSNALDCQQESISSFLGLSKMQADNIKHFDHHLAHAASAFFTSGFHESAILVIDGMGELDTISIYEASQSHIEKIAWTEFPNSLGRFYGAVCRYLGFWGATKEGKVMSLSALGDPVYKDDLGNMINWSTGLPRIDINYFSFGITPLQPSQVSDDFKSVFGDERHPKDQILKRHCDIAASVQAVLEESVLRLAYFAKALTGYKNLCYSGGVALNCKANSVIRESGVFSEMYIPTAPHDAGLSIGCAYLSQLDEESYVHTPRLQKIYILYL